MNDLSNADGLQRDKVGQCKGCEWKVMRDARHLGEGSTNEDHMALSELYAQSEAPKRVR